MPLILLAAAVTSRGGASPRRADGPVVPRRRPAPRHPTFGGPM